MAAGAKTGRPKYIKRIKSLLEEGSKKKKKKKGTMKIKLTLTDGKMESGELEDGKVGII